LKAYASVIARDRGFPTLANPVIFEGVAELETALRQEKVDIISAPSAEILALPGELLAGPYLVTVRGQVPGEEYLLLVRADRGLSTPADLKGRRVTTINNVRGSLAECWLEVLLGARGPGALGNFLGELKLVSKPSLAVLPVFFGQMDACVITRESFALVTEMNPQVGRELRILAVSPLVVPAITCFRRNIDPKVRAEVVDSLATLHANVSGQQVLTIFQSERVEARDDSALESTRRLLADRAQLEASPPNPPSAPGSAAKPVAHP
jgi:phosphonate transport system substrate-binding protein